MGIINQGIFGGVRNKIGNLVGSSWKGIPVLKTKPLSVANPRTTAQVEQRDAMKTTVQLGSQILAGCIVPSWNRFAHKMSGFNLWCSLNVDIVKTAGNTITTDLIMAKGKLTPISFVSAVADQSSDTVVFTWSNNPLNQYSSNLDQIGYVYVNVSKNYALAFPSTRVRTDLTVSFTDTLVEVGDEVYGWFYTFRPDGTYVSDSVGFTVNVVA